MRPKNSSSSSLTFHSSFWLRLALIFFWLGSGLTASLENVSAQIVTPTPAAPAATATAAPDPDDPSILRQPLILDLDDGIKTKAELDFPAGPGPFPAVLLLGGSGANDMDGGTPGNPRIRVYKEMLDNLVKRGFAVFKYNKRGLDTYGRVANQRVSDGRTNDVLVNDGAAALRRFLTEPKVDKGRVFILAHSQGTLIAPQVAQKSPNTVQGMVLAGTIADWNAAFDYQLVSRYLETAQELDTNKDGFLLPEEFAAAINADTKVYTNAKKASRVLELGELNYIQILTRQNSPATVRLTSIGDKDGDGRLSIAGELKPTLEAQRAGLLANVRILDNSKESRDAVKSLLDGPKLAAVLPPLKIPVYFQQGSEDERAPLDPIKQVNAKLIAAGTSATLKVYPGLSHVFIPADPSALPNLQQITDKTKLIPAEVTDDQATWLLNRVQALAPAIQISPTVGATTSAPALTTVPTLAGSVAVGTTLSAVATSPAATTPIPGGSNMPSSGQGGLFGSDNLGWLLLIAALVITILGGIILLGRFGRRNRG